MKKVCIVRLLSTRMSIEMSITLMSHANSVMRLLAMRMKFWSIARRTMFRMTAKVTVVVAMMMHALLARKTVCTLSLNMPRRMRRVTMRRMTIWFSRTLMMP